MSGAAESIKIFHTGFCNKVMKNTHGFHHLLLGLMCTDDLKLREEAMGYCNECIFRPSAEPVHGAPRDETREF